jgi:hypothetical protein
MFGDVASSGKQAPFAGDTTHPEVDVTTDAAEDAPGQIAQYLRDHAIQRIFAVGLGLTALAERLDEPELQRRLAGYVDDLDGAISAIYLAAAELTADEHD